MKSSRGQYGHSAKDGARERSLKIEIWDLKLNKIFMELAKAKEEKESTWLKIALEQAHANFMMEKKEIEVAY